MREERIKSKESISERVRRLVDNDPVTIADQFNFHCKWGDWPAGRRASKRLTRDGKKT